MAQSPGFAVQGDRARDLSGPVRVSFLCVFVDYVLRRDEDVGMKGKLESEKHFTAQIIT